MELYSALALPCFCRSPTDNETRMFYEIVIAPGYTKEGLETLKGKSKTLRILEAAPRAPSGRQLRQVAGGWLMQVRQVCQQHAGAAQDTVQPRIREVCLALQRMLHINASPCTM